MTTPQHIGRSLDEAMDLEIFDRPPAVNPDNATDADIAKATVILRALSDAGLKPQYEFRPDEAKRLWGVTLSQYSLEVLIEAIGDFIRSPDKEFPTLGQVEQAARFTEREIEHEERDAANVGECSECDDVHWVRYEVTIDVPIGKDHVVTAVRSHLMRPCSLCPDMAKAYDLYMRGHFDIDHVLAGGCPVCREYQRPWRKGR
jgi:hypothetical protein